MLHLLSVRSGRLAASLQDMGGGVMGRAMDMARKIVWARRDSSLFDAALRPWYDTAA